MSKTIKDKISPQEKTININIYSDKNNIEKIVAKTILKDFLQFKSDNELNKCSLKQSKIKLNSIDVTFKTEKVYSNLSDEDKIHSDFDEFILSNLTDSCQISNIHYEDDKYKVEYIIPRKYVLNFTFNENEKTDEN